MLDTRKWVYVFYVNCRDVHVARERESVRWERECERGRERGRERNKDKYIKHCYTYSILTTLNDFLFFTSMNIHIYIYIYPSTVSIINHTCSSSH